MEMQRQKEESALRARARRTRVRFSSPCTRRGRGEKLTQRWSAHVGGHGSINNRGKRTRPATRRGPARVQALIKRGVVLGLYMYM